MSEGRFLTAQWRNLVMANFVVDPAVLQSYIPRGTVLDSFEGKTYISVVAFQFLQTKVLGIPIPFHRDFEEINLRFYVKRESVNGFHAGVVFIREIVPRRAVAFLARVIYQEPYIQMPTRSDIAFAADRSQGRFTYGWKLKNEWCQLGALFKGMPEISASHSIEHFISERYWGYCKQSDGSTIEYRIEHPKWAVWHAYEAMFNCDVVHLYGEPLSAALKNPPASVFVAEGSGVSVYRGVRL